LRKTNIPLWDQVVHRGIFILNFKPENILKICSGQGAWQMNPMVQHILRQLAIVKAVKLESIFIMGCVHFYISFCAIFCF
jgi:hypothetical protein